MGFSAPNAVFLVKVKVARRADPRDLAERIADSRRSGASRSVRGKFMGFFRGEIMLRILLLGLFVGLSLPGLPGLGNVAPQAQARPAASVRYVYQVWIYRH